MPGGQGPQCCGNDADLLNHVKILATREASIPDEIATLQDLIRNTADLDCAAKLYKEIYHIIVCNRTFVCGECHLACCVWLHHHLELENRKVETQTESGGVGGSQVLFCDARCLQHLRLSVDNMVQPPPHVIHGAQGTYISGSPRVLPTTVGRRPSSSYSTRCMRHSSISVPSASRDRWVVWSGILSLGCTDIRARSVGGLDRNVFSAHMEDLFGSMYTTKDSNSTGDRHGPEPPGSPLGCR